MWEFSTSPDLGIANCTFENDGIVQMEDGAILIKAEDSGGNRGNGYDIYCYPENSTYPAGIYFGAYIDSTRCYLRIVNLTIPGYGKFPIIKTIDKEFLPANLQFGESEIFANTLSWNGSFEGLEQSPSEPEWYKLSDVIVTEEDLINGIIVEYQEAYDNIAVDYLTLNATTQYRLLLHSHNGNREIYDIYNDMAEMAPIVRFTNDGIFVTKFMNYLYDYPFESRIHNITIPNFNKFTEPVIKKIDKKYLPDDIGGMPKVTAEDNGKFLRVVDGAWAAVSLPNAEEVGF